MKEGKGVSMPELCEMTQGRNNPEAYSFYCHHYLPHIVGRGKWNYMVRTKIDIEDVASISDEALGLVLLENSWERWSWEHTKTKEQIKEEVRKKIDEREIPRTMYTLGRGRKDKQRSGSGWSNDGISRFGELAKMTEDHRRDDDNENGETSGFDVCFADKVAEWMSTDKDGSEETDVDNNGYEAAVEACVEL